jgi:hypothetical protein
MLKDIQQQFLRVILKQSDDVSFIASNKPLERLNIYRQTIIENIRHALSIIYPGVWQLLGKTCADNLAKAFVMQFNHLPVSGCLDDFGADFPVFLTQIPELKQINYLHDYAAYEYQCHQLYGAKDGLSIDIMQLEKVPPQQLEKLRFKFIDALVTFKSKYPLDLVKTLLSNQDSSEIKLPNRGSQALLVRSDNELKTFWLEFDIWLFIKGLSEGLSLKNALAQVHNTHAEFDMSYAVYFIFEKKLVQSLILK